MIRIAIADDHAIVRAGLQALIVCESDMRLVGGATDGNAAVALAASQAIDVFLMDLSMPHLDGVEAIARIRAASPQTRVLVLSMHATPEFVRPALRAGAQGYVVKGAGLEALVAAIRAVHAGDRFLDPAAAAAMQDALADDSAVDSSHDIASLTPREREVLCMVAMGHTNRTMAEAIGVSPKTIDAHRTNLMRKLGIHDAQGLTRLAMRRGMLDGLVPPSKRSDGC